MIRFAHILSLFVLSFVACDAGDAATVTFRGETAQAWGPCKGGPGGACEPGLFCYASPKHSICLPPCGVGCPAIPADLCGGAAPACLGDGRCAFECSDDSDCATGTECADGVCAWPN